MNCQNLYILCFLTFTMTSCTLNKEPLIIGHRGAKGHIAENTLPSIAKAIELGVDGIEIDIFKCASGELVVFHLVIGMATLQYHHCGFHCFLHAMRRHLVAEHFQIAQQFPDRLSLKWDRNNSRF